MQRFGTDEENFLGDKAYQKCTAFTVLQIGEQVKRLSKELTYTYDDVDWSDIAKMRDFMAHEYERLLPTIPWRTINGDIPRLREREMQADGLRNRIGKGGDSGRIGRDLTGTLRDSPDVRTLL